MTNAKKCDRCGKYFDPNSFTEMPELVMRKERYSVSYQYDLCDDCAKDFKKFMKNETVYEIAKPGPVICHEVLD